MRFGTARFLRSIKVPVTVMSNGASPVVGVTLMLIVVLILFAVTGTCPLRAMIVVFS